MNSSTPSNVDLQHTTLTHFTSALASTRPSPGAGAAGAVALALAASCAAKAASLSARHHPEDPALDEAHRALLALVTQALDEAAEDASAFEAMIKGADDATERLEAGGHRVLRLAEKIDAICIALQGRVIATMTGDLVAAAALLHAGRRVQQRNLAEVAAPTPEEGAEVADFGRLIVATGLTAVEVASELDLDTRMVEVWIAGREQPPRAVELALRHLATAGVTTRRMAAQADIGRSAG
jgi:hypothetical protein